MYGVCDMHEYSLAEGIIHTVRSVALKEGLRDVTEVTISVGDLAQIDREILLDALRILGNEYGLGSTNFVITSEESTFKCNSCGFEWRWSQVRDLILKELCGDITECDNPVHFIPDLINAFMRCPKCNSPDFEITSGYDVRVVSIRGVR